MEYVSIIVYEKYAIKKLLDLKRLKIIQVCDTLYASYPEGFYDYGLISCLNCGQVYAVNYTSELYSNVLRRDLLDRINCVKCNEILSKTSAPYPEKYLSHDGNVYKYKVSRRYPSSKYQRWVKLPEIYSIVWPPKKDVGNTESNSDCC